MNSVMNRIALGAGYALGFLGIVMMPLLVGVYISKFGVKEDLAGLLVFCDLGALSFTSITLSTRVHRWPKRVLSVLGILIIVVANAICLVVDAFAYLLAARILAGIGAGALLTSVCALASHTPSPERTYALMNIMFGVLGAALYTLMPFVLDTLEGRGIFLLYIVPAILLSPTILFLTETVSAYGDADKAMVINLPVVLLFLGLAIFTISDVGIWAYIDVRAQQIAISLESRSNIYMLVALGNIFAPLAAYLLGRRLGLVFPLALAALAMSAACICIALSVSFGLWATGLVMLSGAFTFSITYVFGICAIVDQTGRVAGAAPGITGVAQAIAPLLAGFVIVTSGSFSYLAGIAAILCIIGGLCVCYPTWVVSNENEF